MAAPSPIATPQPYMVAIMGAGSRLKEYTATVFKQRKAWTEVLDRNNFSKPTNVAEAITRVKKNSAYFKVNYLIIMLVTCAVTFLMHPSSLFVLSLLFGGWIYITCIRDTPLVIGGRALSDQQKMLGMAAISFVTIFFLTSVGTVLFSAISISLAVITLHGVMRQPDDLFLDEVESNNGFLSILTGPPEKQVGSNNV